MLVRKQRFRITMVMTGVLLALLFERAGSQGGTGTPPVKLSSYHCKLSVARVP